MERLKRPFIRIIDQWFETYKFWLLIVFVNLICFFPNKVFAQGSDTAIVYFKTGDSLLSNDMKANLLGFIRFDSANQKMHVVSITGYCDYVGSTLYNDSLSLFRARNVKKFLANMGVNIDSVFIQGVGERHLFGKPLSSVNKAVERRVSVVFIRVNKEAFSATSELKKDGLFNTSKDTQRDTNDVVLQLPKGVIKSKHAFDDLTDSNLKKGSRLILSNVNFVPDKAIPLSWAYITLDDVVKALRLNRKLKILIEGHICCRSSGSESQEDLQLSIDRAKFVYDYLGRKGINKKRMSYTGQGAKNKLFPEERTERERVLNRRIEIVVVEK